MSAGRGDTQPSGSRRARGIYRREVGSMSVGAGRCPAGSEEQHAGLSASFDLEQLATEPVTHRAAEADRHVQSPPSPQPVMASGEFPLKGQRQVCIHPGPGAESRCMRNTVGVGVWQSALGGGLPGLSSCSATLANVSCWPWGSRPTPQTVHCLRSSWSTPFSQSPRRASDVPRIPGPSPGPAQHLWNRLPIQEAAPRNPSLPQDSTGRPGPSMVPPIKHRCSHSLPSGPVSNRASGDQRHLTRDDICYKEKAFDLVGHTFRSEKKG